MLEKSLFPSLTFLTQHSKPPTVALLPRPRTQVTTSKDVFGRRERRYMLAKTLSFRTAPKRRSGTCFTRQRPTPTAHSDRPPFPSPAAAWLETHPPHAARL